MSEETIIKREMLNLIIQNTYKIMRKGLLKTATVNEIVKMIEKVLQDDN